MVRGGRFFHVSSGGSKRWAVSQIKSRLDARTGEPSKVIACGDAPNDTEMLQFADYAVLFPGELSKTFLCSNGEFSDRAPQISHSPNAGPEPWLAAVNKVLRLGESV